MRQARSDNATTIATIFVNPRQFNEAADYQRYPRNEARDLAICEDEGIDLVFVPPVEEVYPPGFDTTVAVGAVARPLEGAARPGHFEGVATVVAILFNLIGAERAYFGQKDAQQVMVIRQMARDLAIPTEVIACPTVREPDGLALSSRNVRLQPDDRERALALRAALQAASASVAGGERDAATVVAAARAAMTTYAVDPEYLAVVDADTFTELGEIDRRALITVAARVGDVRLIDNHPLTPNGSVS
jgi:pantoate--beta-alanine ligase